MLEQLLRDLNSQKRRGREKAIKQARRLPPEQLLQLINLEARKSKQHNKVAGYSFTGAALALILFLFSLAGRNLVALLPCSLAVYFGMCLVASKDTIRARRNITRILKKVDDSRFVGPALVLLAEHGHNSSVRSNIVDVLNRLLPDFRADQAKLLTPGQQKALVLNLAEPYRNIKLSLCLLKALEQVGDAQAIPVVEKIAAKKRPNDRQKPVVEAAQECLPYLQVRVQQRQQSQTLLRAADASQAIVSGTLLRPASPSADNMPSEQLLRVVSAAEEREKCK